MVCTNCGNNVSQGEQFCSYCGAKVAPQQSYPAQNTYPQQSYPAQNTYTPAPQQSYYNAPAQTPYAPAVPANLSWKEFYNRFAAKNTRSWANTFVFICYFTAVISVVLMAVFGQMLGLMDVLFYGIMGTLLLVTKHWAFSLIPTIYSGIFTLLNMANDGAPSGIFALVTGIMCTAALIKLSKAYGAYKQDGSIPADVI